MKTFYGVLIFCALVSCRKEVIVSPLQLPTLMEIPKGFPLVEFPEGNEFTQARWELGKKLFYDPIMSSDSTISCASCHQSNLSFSDDLSFSLGVRGQEGTRNSPSLANVAYHPYFTREGGVATLEMQVLVPIQEHNEFDTNILIIADRLNNDSTYIAMAQSAYGRMPDHFVITRAIACFERSLLSGNSPYDLYLNYGDESAMNMNALKGMDLFFSERTSCSECHSGFNFTNYAFENNGLYEEYEDTGRFRLTNDEADRALFKVPSLRNVALTAPYMHDGSIGSLEEVVEHYQSGGEDNSQKNPAIKPLNLTDSEKNDLLAFLKSLTDEAFVLNPLFRK